MVTEKKLHTSRDTISLNEQSLWSRTGRQKRALKPLQPTGLAVNLTTLPQQLGKLGYQTHMVGKWHLGKTALCQAAALVRLPANQAVL